MPCKRYAPEVMPPELLIVFLRVKPGRILSNPGIALSTSAVSIVKSWALNVITTSSSTTEVIIFLLVPVVSRTERLII